MNENRRIALISGAILLALATGFYFFFWPLTPPAAPVQAAVQAPAPESPAGSEVVTTAEPLPAHFPVPAPAAEAEPLPPLGESDGPLAAALAGFANAGDLAKALVSEQLIRRLVVTVDNLPRERLAMNDRAFKRVPGELIVRSRDGTYSLNPSNEARYVPLVTLAKTVGAENAAQLYLRFYPLFDQAYRELGTPGRHFNDRLVQVIDHLLATPVVDAPIALVQPKVFYEFADPALEARSAGQKMLIRMGSVNQAQVKAWLQTFRKAVTGAGSPVN